MPATALARHPTLRMQQHPHIYRELSQSVFIMCTGFYTFLIGHMLAEFAIP